MSATDELLAQRDNERYKLRSRNRIQGHARFCLHIVTLIYIHETKPPGLCSHNSVLPLHKHYLHYRWKKRGDLTLCIEKDKDTAVGGLQRIQFFHCLQREHSAFVTGIFLELQGVHRMFRGQTLRTVPFRIFTSLALEGGWARIRK